MNYPIVLHKDPDTDYGVTIPDLPGCFSAGSTLDEAMAMAHEAAESYLETIMVDGQPVPDPRPMEEHLRNSDFADGIWAVISVDPSTLLKAKRINITMPESILTTIDRFAADTGETRSGLLVRAVSSYIAGRKMAPSEKHAIEPTT